MGREIKEPPKVIIVHKWQSWDLYAAVWLQSTALNGSWEAATCSYACVLWDSEASRISTLSSHPDDAVFFS